MTDGFARRRLLGVVSGGVLGQCCYAVAKLGVADLLAAGPRTVPDLAAECGADPRVLHRMLRALAAAGLFRPAGPDAYELTSVGSLLRSDTPGSVRRTAVLHGEEVARSFTEIMHTVHTGQPAFDEVHGRPFYDYLAEHPAVADTFAAAMGNERVPPVLQACDLTGSTKMVDVGGGDGALLADVLTAHPHLRATLLELPDTIRAARARLARLSERVALIEGSFFDTIPSGGDVYVLSRVLHNWTDEHAEMILTRVRTAMDEQARLLILERLLPGEISSLGTAMVDLLMLGLLEGRDRTEAEYRALLDKAGLDATAVHAGPTSADESAIEARAR